ncbi:UNVERIFIED_CONTAM: NAD(+) kinase [Siphonaria sp. JEL0065]|nr:NAD(+) kinase [Siphonaria sp. JEL0065]
MASFIAQRGIEVRVGPGIPLNDNISAKFQNVISHWDPEYCISNENEIDLVVTLGGDGTVLYTSSLFQNRVPPIVPFHLGSLGFLTVFKHSTYEAVMNDILDGKPQHMNLRMRLQADVYQRDVSISDSSDLGDLVFSRKVLNEVVVDRGVNSTMVNLDLFFSGDGDHISTVLADGLVIATPTGSTAYNLSAGGPLVHPSKSSVLVTPICPHTLTARPMILPSSLDLTLSLSHNARSTAWISFDGRDRFELGQGNSVVIRTAVSSPFPSICRESSSKDEPDVQDKAEESDMTKSKNKKKDAQLMNTFKKFEILDKLWQIEERRTKDNAVAVKATMLAIRGDYRVSQGLIILKIAQYANIAELESTMNDLWDSNSQANGRNTKKEPTRPITAVTIGSQDRKRQGSDCSGSHNPDWEWDTCWKCGGEGHLSKDCPNKKKNKTKGGDNNPVVPAAPVPISNAAVRGANQRNIPTAVGWAPRVGLLTG